MIIYKKTVLFKNEFYGFLFNVINKNKIRRVIQQPVCVRWGEDSTK
ncbi:hypothetical protein CbC4_1401 [Clostridium botulinum BKT015925]|nr:hypothetical protein CbC4_1401 [Clostridium botulinum BKT015925]